jgi:hypothetical protein
MNSNSSAILRCPARPQRDRLDLGSLEWGRFPHFKIRRDRVHGPAVGSARASSPGSATPVPGPQVPSLPVPGAPVRDPSVKNSLVPGPAHPFRVNRCRVLVPRPPRLCPPVPDPLLQGPLVPGPQVQPFFRNLKFFFFKEKPIL